MTDPRIERLTEMVAALRQEGYNRQESIELLYARIEALEAAQQPEQITYEPQWHRLSEREPQDCDRCIYQLRPSVLREYGIWCSIRNGFWAPDTGLFVGDPERISWRLAMPHEISPQPVPDHIADASKMVAPPAPAGVQRRYPSPATIAECGGPCDSQGPEACDCGLLQELNPPSPAPAGGLVELIRDELGHHGTASASAVIRKVAAWLRSDGPDWPSVASLLEQEANR